MPTRMDQNASNNKRPRSSMSVFPASQPVSGNDAGARLPGPGASGWPDARASGVVLAVALWRSGSARVSIIVVILPLAITAEIVVGKHRSQQGQTVLLDSLIGFQSAFAVGNAASKHQDQRVSQRRDDALVRHTEQWRSVHQHHIVAFGQGFQDGSQARGVQNLGHIVLRYAVGKNRQTGQTGEGSQ